MHRGNRSISSNLNNDDLKNQIDLLLDDFVTKVNICSQAYQTRLATVRSRLECSIAVILDDENVSLIAQISHGMPISKYFLEQGKIFSRNDLDKIARFDIGFNDYFIVIFSKELINQSTEERYNEIAAIAQQYVLSEIERFHYMTNIIQVSPIFGAAKYTLDEKLVFVLMPFDDKRNKIYNTVIKPTIESASIGLVCKRADDIKSNTSIMQDIWKNICEARVIIADLSDFNPNVMYELGIAHTVGKDTILLYEKTKLLKFPFDLAHIRRIEYTNEISSTKNLESGIIDTIKSVISGKTIIHK